MMKFMSRLLRLLDAIRRTQHSAGGDAPTQQTRRHGPPPGAVFPRAPRHVIPRPGYTFPHAPSSFPRRALVSAEVLELLRDAHVPRRDLSPEGRRLDAAFDA